MADAGGSALVIAFGNPLRQDDGIGWAVADALERRPVPGLAVVTAHQLTPELAEPVGQARRVIFVDASEGNAPGSIACRSVAAMPPPSASFSHQLHPASLLALASAVFGAQPPAWVVTVDGASFGLGVGLSPAVAAAVPKVVDLVHELAGTDRVGPGGGRTAAGRAGTAS